ncbi:acyl-CoA transferase [Pigmentiphaga aceris]|uniref:Acyl-CoA transferase n=1 Tax=Pigmentiphaga aceris TaxID=1940612 RepID=A0A5C0AYQ3_9BURK|nr:CoA transferase [Pigmentiphaga aceris]QEI07488.1 acyl-CoA transferase [Pigmentiphaga aceris]
MSDARTDIFLPEIWQAMRGDAARLDDVSLSLAGGLPSAFPVSMLAQATVGSAALALSEVIEAQGGMASQVKVDGRLASFWFDMSLRPQNWTPPSARDELAADYPTRDGWIRLHTNAPHHRRAAKRVLGDCRSYDTMAESVAQWDKDALETAVVQAGGCAAAMRDHAAWLAHPQGIAVGADPLVLWNHGLPGTRTPWRGTPARPLQGLRVLDLTRVLAGPTASRFLAGFGAEVLRIDPPWWDEPGLVPEMTLGKQCTQLNLTIAADRERFGVLLSEADVFLHGYRADALENLGFGAEWRQQHCPGLVDVSLNAYGWQGPWQARRGFDSLVQMSCGIAEAGMRWAGKDKPVPLPVQGLDHGTGYLLAAAALRGLAERLTTGAGARAQVSLARTAKLLMDAPDIDPPPAPLAPETSADLAFELEATAWGPARRLLAPVTVGEARMRWHLPAGPLHRAPAAWPDAARNTQ